MTQTLDCDDLVMGSGMAGLTVAAMIAEADLAVPPRNALRRSVIPPEERVAPVHARQAAQSSPSLLFRSSTGNDEHGQQDSPTTVVSAEADGDARA
jgi:hypothetical protein